MALGGGAFRTRAASLLHPFVSVQDQHDGQQANRKRSATISPTRHAELSTIEKEDGTEPAGVREESGSLSTAAKPLSSSNDDAAAENKSAQRLVRTIPRECYQSTGELDTSSIYAGF